MPNELYRARFLDRTVWIRQDNDDSYQVSIETDRRISLCRDFWDLGEAQSAAHNFVHSHLGSACRCAQSPSWERMDEAAPSDPAHYSALHS
jgi:hypothetical protein